MEICPGFVPVVSFQLMRAAFLFFLTLVVGGLRGQEYCSVSLPVLKAMQLAGARAMELWTPSARESDRRGVRHLDRVECMHADSRLANLLASRCHCCLIHSTEYYVRHISARTV
jgi:hypothetical protein